MADVKIVLRKKPNKDGTLPIAIRITKDRKTSFIHLGYSIMPEDWDEKEKRVKKSYPNSVRLNNLISKKLSDVKNGALDAEIKQSAVTARAIKSEVKPKVAALFFPQAQDYLDTLKAGNKYNQYTADKPRIEKFKEYLKGQNIAFADISPGLLEKFVPFLKNYHLIPQNENIIERDQLGRKKRAKSKKPMSERTIANHLVAIRSVYSHARKNKAIKKEDSPFGSDDGVKIKIPETTKVGISQDDIYRLETV
jgi:hypothetical protein